MNIPSTTYLSPAFLPEELIAEILSLLNVKTLIQLRCVCKSWNTLISDPTFVKKHLNRSSRNPHLALVWENYRNLEIPLDCFQCFVVPILVPGLLQDPSVTIPAKSGHLLKNLFRIVGSCNGLVCFLFYSFHRTETATYQNTWFRFWNPATRTRSKKLGLFRDYTDPNLGGFKFTFCFDNSTGIYKVVAFHAEGEEQKPATWKSEVKIFNYGDNYWKKIQSFPIIPLSWLDTFYNRLNDGVHFSGTVNWLALRDNAVCLYSPMRINHAEQFVIISLDLSTETYTQLQLPRGFNEVPLVQPTLRVLLDCLCFSHEFKGTELVVWQMKEYGVHESWTQLLRVSCQSLPSDYYGVNFQLLGLSENGDVMILASQYNQAFIYHRKENRVESTNTCNPISWFSAVDYFESLVSTD